MKNGTPPLYATTTNGMTPNAIKQFSQEYKKYITRNNKRRWKPLKFFLIIGLIALGSFGLNYYRVSAEREARAAFVEKAVLDGWRYEDAFRMWQAIHH